MGGGVACYNAFDHVMDDFDGLADGAVVFRINGVIVECITLPLVMMLLPTRLRK